MKVTNVKLRNLEGHGKLKAIGSITFDDFNKRNQMSRIPEMCSYESLAML